MAFTENVRLLSNLFLFLVKSWDSVCFLKETKENCPQSEVLGHLV